MKNGNQKRRLNIIGVKNVSYAIKKSNGQKNYIGRINFNNPIVERDLDRWICNYLADGNDELAIKIRMVHKYEIAKIRNYMFMFLEGKYVTLSELLAYFNGAMLEFDYNKEYLTNVKKKKNSKNQKKSYVNKNQYVMRKKNRVNYI